jgi:hypothetical protein
MEESQIEESKKDFLKFWENISLEKKDETLIILKGHLLLEDLMSEYCASHVENEKPLEDARFSFTQLMHLVKALKKRKPPGDWVWPSIQKLNVLRNKLAHKLTPTEYKEKRDEFISYIRTNSNREQLFSDFPETYEKLAMAIFIVHTALSIYLKFKPKEHLWSILALDEKKAG